SGRQGRPRHLPAGRRHHLRAKGADLLHHRVRTQSRLARLGPWHDCSPGNRARRRPDRSRVGPTDNCEADHAGRQSCRDQARSRKQSRAERHDQHPCENFLATMSAETELRVIEPSVGWVPVDWPELWAYRELLGFLVWRDAKVRYKQTVLGAAWAVLQPLM